MSDALTLTTIADSASACEAAGSDEAAATPAAPRILLNSASGAGALPGRGAQTTLDECYDAAKRLGRAPKWHEPGRRFSLRCPFPAHRRGDVKASAAIYLDGGKFLASCGRCGTITERICAALGVVEPWKRKGLRPLRAPVDIYEYTDPDGVARNRKKRLQGKRFVWEHREGDTWVTGRRGVPQLFELPDLIAADPSHIVFLVEGEKDAKTLRHLGFVATTAPDGKVWRDHFTPYFADRRVCIIADDDADGGGQAYAKSVARALTGTARAVAVTTVPLRVHKDGGDASDWVAEGATADDFRQLADAVLTHRAPSSVLPDGWEDCDSVRDAPAPRWLVDGVIPEDGYAILYGRPGAGKSFVALAWALSIATGQPWQGRAVTQGAVAYIAAEGQAGFPKRVKAWRATHGASGPFYLLRRALKFTPATVASLVDDLRRLPQPPVLIVIDTLAACIDGNENDKDMQRFTAAVHQLRAPFHAAALVLHHPGKNGDLRGHSSLPGDIDALWLATKKPGTDVVRLTNKKQKDCAFTPDIALRLDVVSLDDGETSCVLRPATLDSEPGESRKPRRGLQCTILSIMRATPDRTWSYSDLLRACAVSVGHDVNDKTFYSALNTLNREGDIKKDGSGWVLADSVVP
jgi:hypothetical protein